MKVDRKLRAKVPKWLVATCASLALPTVYFGAYAGLSYFGSNQRVVPVGADVDSGSYPSWAQTDNLWFPKGMTPSPEYVVDFKEHIGAWRPPPTSVLERIFRPLIDFDRHFLHPSAE